MHPADNRDVVRAHRTMSFKHSRMSAEHSALWRYFTAIIRRYWRAKIECTDLSSLHCMLDVL
ncbi:MAG: hypothetical protein GX885_06280 [Methanomicrobiales archaeon]|nr:hypothetical protein [Methanomicrobiales archaeon]